MLLNGALSLVQLFIVERYEYIITQIETERSWGKAVASYFMEVAWNSREEDHGNLRQYR
jgi:hypothetical protein